MQRGIFTQKGVSPLKADENKNVFPMAYILVLSMFRGLGHYGIAAVKMGCGNAEKERKKAKTFLGYR